MKTYVGIDVSKAWLDVAYPGQEEAITLRLANTETGIAELLATLPEGHHCLLEATGIYHFPLAYHLQEQQADFTVFNPISLHAYRQSVLGITKTDQADALLLLRLGQERQPAPTRLPQADWQALRQRFLVWQDARKQLHKLSMRQQEWQFYPQQDALAQEMLLAQRSLLEEQIRQLEEAWNRELPESMQQQITLAETVKGIGRKTAGMLLFFTQKLNNFASSKQLAKFIGIAPTVYQSGKYSKRGHICRKGNGYLRSLLYNCAKSAKRYNPACKALYERLKQKGKPHKVCMVAVMHKLIKQVFAVVQSGVPYQPALP